MIDTIVTVISFVVVALAFAALVIVPYARLWLTARRRPRLDMETAQKTGEAVTGPSYTTASGHINCGMARLPALTVEDLERARDAMEQAIGQNMETYLENLMRENIDRAFRSAPPVDTGSLRPGITWEIEPGAYSNPSAWDFVPPPD
jgi:hypothetical protein